MHYLFFRSWYKGIRIQPFVLLGLCLSILTLSGCAHFSIPAPSLPVKTLPEPAVENSTITLPVTISLVAIMNDLGLSASNNKEQDSHDNIIAGKIRRFLRRQASKKDNMIVQNIYARQLAGKAWGGLQNPIKLRNDLSLLLNPQAVSVSPLTEQGDNIQFVIGLVAKPKLVAGTVAPAKPQPFPAISISSPQPEAGFHMALESELSFDFLGNELTDRLKGRPFNARGKSFMLEKVKLYGSGESVVVAISISGSVKAVLYLSGIPAYDQSTNSLYLRNLEYTLETKNVLAKAAEWMLHTGLQESLAKRATWQMGERIDAAKDLLSNVLNRNLNRQIRLSGKIEDIRPVSVGITDSAIKAVLEADGAVEMQILN